ncbi:hypothetical protein MCOR27_005336 [Pyricularia oryzae]|uniref:Uncharacterized protein n=1 Tax=Pyricularia grisea TaxID=148305 RepID=A0ABQ8N8Q3_PYRGI|nr:hypothetical protein MCOR01_008979 [Pyricularia oryzae]KAI6293105.1 hypothetical protein MCOR33_009379 [Pyricularia grisea]KAH9439664.1 hypothetical protein MCOR02_003205 [Pyricularia oryzae]KAI6254317.1 hypothetical protein MCOR19_009163 [Pyricularia oryzae]KAI6279039.1 hypothetical protein MCOR27_005336 [Pyricularia oryzae]
MCTISSSTATQHTQRDADGDVQMMDAYPPVQLQVDTDEDERISNASTLIENHDCEVDADGDVEMTDAHALDRDDEDKEEKIKSSSSTTSSSAYSSVGRITDVDSVKQIERWAETNSVPNAALTKPSAVKSVSINVGLLRVQYDAEEGHVDIQGY